MTLDRNCAAATTRPHLDPHPRNQPQTQRERERAHALKLYLKTPMTAAPAAASAPVAIPAAAAAMRDGSAARGVGRPRKSGHNGVRAAAEWGAREISLWLYELLETDSRKDRWNSQPNE